jgi:solute carrier family 25 aspartate/glutamate transporter 12/13/solute carrier family 25 carnitine/acylcarnitine transporter 20/29
MTSAAALPSEIMSAGQEFAVSAVAAGMSHIIHHPLYTLKSQMMYYGPEFRMRTFFSKVREQKSFLYRG